MNQMVRQTQTHNTRHDSTSGKLIVGVIFGFIEIILGMRLIFKLLGANPSNGFVKVIYDITQFFVGIFEGIFSKNDVSDTSRAVFEPATLIAIIVIALVAWLVLALMTPRKSSQVETSEYTNHTVSGSNPESDYLHESDNQQKTVYREGYETQKKSDYHQGSDNQQDDRK